MRPQTVMRETSENTAKGPNQVAFRIVAAFVWLLKTQVPLLGQAVGQVLRFVQRTWSQKSRLRASGNLGPSTESQEEGSMDKRCKQ